jgi:hypothetical protein
MTAIGRSAGTLVEISRTRRLAPAVVGLSLLMVLGVFAVGGALGDGNRPCCGGGGIVHVTYTYEGLYAIGINNTYISNGQSVVLEYQIAVPIQMPEQAIGTGSSWASTGIGSFGCSTCSSTTFTPGGGGYIYLIPMASDSPIWGGYILYSSGEKYTTTSLTLTLPAASSISGPGNAEAAFWVGMGGQGETEFGYLGNAQFPFWQAGVDIWPATPAGTGIELWYEAWQSSSDNNPTVVVANNGPSISFGDTVTISISFVSGGGYVCFNVVQTSSQCYTDGILNGDTSASDSEWIIEAPTSNGDILPLPDFGTTDFSGMTSSGLGSSLYYVPLYTGFSCGFLNSCTDPTSGQVPSISPFTPGDLADGYTVSYSGYT